MKPCKIIYLVRHGHIAMPDERKYYLGRTDVPLSPKGIAQAEWLRDYFADKEIKAVYHSPLKRCVQTAQILADNRIACTAILDLQEINMGRWEMVPIEHIKNEQPELYRLRGEQIDTFCPPDGESFLQCQKRSIAAFQNIADAQNEGARVVMAAHAGVNRCILSWAANQPLKDLLTIPQPYACVTKLIWENKQWQIADAVICPEVK